MQIVVDANPLISILIKPGEPIKLLALEELELFAPSLLFEELEKHQEEIIQKSALSFEEIEKLFIILKKRIQIVNEEEFKELREKAKFTCPDPKDVPYFALALHLKCPIWSNEKKLKEQQSLLVYPTHELMKIFGID